MGKGLLRTRTSSTFLTEMIVFVSDMFEEVDRPG